MSISSVFYWSLEFPTTLRFVPAVLVVRQVAERQLNHNMTFQVAVQKLTSLGVKFETLVTKESPSYSKSRTNGWYTVTERIHERL